MGRGLSKLQHWILQQTGARGGITNTEILQGYFSWPEKRPVYGWRSQGYQEPIWTCVREAAFPLSEIGKQRYHVVTVTVSRSIKRLYQRGLMCSIYLDDKMRLTEQGQEWYRLNVVVDPEINQ
jgi:hypothetical protein